MCTSHVHEDTLLKTRQIKVKKTRYKIINPLTHFINKPLYMNFVTTLPRRTSVGLPAYSYKSDTSIESLLSYTPNRTFTLSWWPYIPKVL